MSGNPQTLFHCGRPPYQRYEYLKHSPCFNPLQPGFVFSAHECFTLRLSYFFKVPLFLLRVHFNVCVYIYIYHLGRTSVGTPFALTQGMDNILQPPTRKVVSSLFHRNLIGGFFNQNSCLGSPCASDGLIPLRLVC